jgi:hypothetical protein
MSEDDQNAKSSRGWGSWKVHLLLFFLTAGIGNVLYGVWSRFVRKSPAAAVSTVDSVADPPPEPEEAKDSFGDVVWKTVSQLDDSTREALDETLLESESFIIGTRTFEDGLRKSRRTKLLLTDKRIIAVRKGTISADTRDFPLSKLSSVDFHRGLNSKIELHGSGIDESYVVGYEGGKAFSDAARRLLLE